MSMNVSSVSAYSPVSNVQKLSNSNNVNFKGNESCEDKFEYSQKQSTLTTEQKQEILQKARAKAAGWSLIFGGFDTLYYGLRSDKKVAQQFNLDKTADKNFIKTIKRQQMLCTLPSVIPGFGLIPGIACWLYNKNLDSSKLNV